MPRERGDVSLDEHVKRQSHMIGQPSANDDPKNNPGTTSYDIYLLSPLDTHLRFTRSITHHPPRAPDTLFLLQHLP